MARGKGVDPKARGEALAMLLAGNAASFVSEKTGIPISTLKTWKKARKSGSPQKKKTNSEVRPGEEVRPKNTRTRGVRGEGSGKGGSSSQKDEVDGSSSDEQLRSLPIDELVEIYAKEGIISAIRLQQMLGDKDFLKTSRLAPEALAVAMGVTVDKVARISEAAGDDEGSE